MSDLEIVITNTRPEHATQVPLVICAAYQIGDVTPEECYDNYQIPSPQDVLKQIERFPEGQFVALHGDRVVGIAITLRVNHPPEAKPHRWLEAIGGLSIGNHDPNGEWLYGMEFSVHPDYQGHGIGVKLYEARFAMVKRLNLKGFYAGGMLMGYHRYKDSMTPYEYGEAVMHREIKDPTVTMQMNRGFRAVAVIENYLEEELSGNAGMLIVWDNPDYKP